MLKYLFASLLILILLLTGCSGDVPPPPDTVPPTPEAANTPTPATSVEQGPESAPDVLAETPLVISEVMAGEFDYVELYNASLKPMNLRGYRVIYQLGTDNKDRVLYTFERDFFLPEHTYFLLGQEGDDLSSPADATFSQQMNTKTGGVGLYDPDGKLADALAWGKAAAMFVEGSPLGEMPKANSFERLPGGEAGNYSDTNSNEVDFVIAKPSPQNSGHLPLPLPPHRLDVRLAAPNTIEPGQSFAYELIVENLTGEDLNDLTLHLPLPADLEVETISAAGQQRGNQITWSVARLADGAKVSRQVTVRAPYTYLHLLATGHRVEGSALETPVFGAARVTEVTGGVVPIQIARALEGERVTIEGIATMYTGGYYAGGGNVKFYLQDETGAIQIQVFDENGPVPTVQVGDRARVSGTISVYRDSIQLSPDLLPDDVEIVSQEDPLPPERFAVADVTANPDNAGRIVAINGQITRADEFTYSYEIDLLDDEGNTIFVYVDKLTGLTTDEIEVGNLYLTAGILEYYQGRWELRPRLAGDFRRIYPEVLRVEISAPVTVQPGRPVEYTLTAYNHTKAPLTEVAISSPIPGKLVSINDGGFQEGDTVRWVIPTLAPGGASTSVHFAVAVDETQGQLQLVNAGYAATALEWQERAAGPPFITFVGENVPIWAIQGPTFKTPYPNRKLQTEGVVTALFDPAEIPGFFIQMPEQMLEADPDQGASGGLFVNTGEENIDVVVGDLVQVQGVIKEVSGQTQLILNDLTILAQDVTLPPAVPLDPPPDIEAANAYYEALEGVLVTASGVAVSPISKYGETNMIVAGHKQERVMRGGDTGLLITFDEGSWVAQHDDLSTLPFSITTGDRIEGVTGPLAYTFGQYKIEPLVPPRVIPGDFEQQATLAEIGPHEFSIAAFNVENFFDHKDPNPSSPPRPSRQQYLHKALKIANTIAAMGYPTIVGFSEVENGAALEAVAGQPPLGAYDYRAVLVEGRDSRGIDVGYLVRGDRAEIVNFELRLDDEQLFTRGPLVLETRLSTASGALTLYTIANHFVSLGAGFEATEPRRIKQAQWNLDLANEILAQNPDAYIAILGDLNTFYDASSIDLLREGGFVHTFETLSPEARYTYIYQGASQVLDHILVTPNLAGLMSGVDVLHVNADFPPPIPGDESPRRTSDHDPVVVRFEGP